MRSPVVVDHQVCKLLDRLVDEQHVRHGVDLLKQRLIVEDLSVVGVQHFRQEPVFSLIDLDSNSLEAFEELISSQLASHADIQALENRLVSDAVVSLEPGLDGLNDLVDTAG